MARSLDLERVIPAPWKAIRMLCSQTTPAATTSVMSIPTTWKWRQGRSILLLPRNSYLFDMETKLILISLSSYSGTDVVADVSLRHVHEFNVKWECWIEIMIWLAALGGADPISSTGSPIATPTIAGTTWISTQGRMGKPLYIASLHLKVTSFLLTC